MAAKILRLVVDKESIRLYSKKCEGHGSVALAPIAGIRKYLSKNEPNQRKTLRFASVIGAVGDLAGILIQV